MITVTKTIKHGALEPTITVRAEVGMDKYVERILFRRIYQIVTGEENYDGTDYWTVKVQAINDFVELVNRTVKVDSLPIAWPTPESGDKEICAGWDYLREIPMPVYEAWLKLLEEANEPPGDPDTQPPENLPDGKKKTQK